VESSLAQVEHQIWLLRNVLWWYLLPLALSALAFFAQVAWQERSGGWWTALAVSVVIALVVIVFAGVYWLNQYAVRSELEPRRLELETLHVSLDDKTPDAS
jgi:membrane protein YdbS with pleckstrin-like domain